MSSLSVSGSGQSLSQYLQSLYSSQQSASTASALSTTSTTSTTSTSPTTATPTIGTDADGDGSSGATQGVPHGHHHHGGKGGGELFKDVQSAVTSALQSAQSGDSSTDPNQVIQDAIAKVLKNHTNPAQAGATSAAGSDPNGDGDTDAAGAAGSDPTSAQSAFAQLLQSNGVDPQQFHQDFFSAIQSAQNGGSTDASSALSSLPPGSLVDTLA